MFHYLQQTSQRGIFTGLAGAAFVLFGFFGLSQIAYAADTLVSQQYQDLNNDGYVDTIILEFDTNLTACTFDAADWSVVTPGTVNITGITGFSNACNGSSPDLFLTVTSGTRKTGGGTSPVISYANAGTANSIQDSGNISAKSNRTVADAAKPIFTIVDLTDSDTDGFVDEINFVWSEVIDTNDGVAPVAADLPTTLLPDGSTADFSAATISDPAGGTQVINVTGVTGQQTINTGIGSTAISGDMSGKWKDALDNTPHITAATSQETVTEVMAPLVVSSVPGAGLGGANSASPIVLTFSENIDSITYTLSPTRTLASGTSFPASVVTLSGTKLSGLNTFTITSAPDENGNAFGQFMSTGTTSFTFTVSSSSDEAPTPLTYEIDLNDLSSYENLVSGSLLPISWSTSGTGAVSGVTLSYTTNGGETWETIVQNTENDGLYTWSIPTSITSSFMIKAEATDLVSVLDTDTSEELTLSSGSSEEEVDEDEVSEDDADSEEQESSLHDGHYIKGSSWSTVYYVDGSVRRPFLDTQTYFTYADSFDDVVEVSDAVLADYTIGSPMLPRANTVLIKIQSVNNVYALGEDNGSAVLRWISTEELAVALYGSSWSNYVIDVPVTAWSHFVMGEDVESSSDLSVDMGEMLERAELNAR